MAQIIAPVETTMRTEHTTAFDLWLHCALTCEFGAAEGDALPEELMSLLPQDEDAGTA